MKKHLHPGELARDSRFVRTAIEDRFNDPRPGLRAAGAYALTARSASLEQGSIRLARALPIKLVR